MLTAQFHEDWFSDGMCGILADLAFETFGLDGDIVEIGSWEGKSTIALANAMYPQNIYAVDTWKGSPGEISWELAKERNVFLRFRENIDTATKGNVTIAKMGWRHFFHEYGQPLKFVFIDAEHSYKEVRENIELVLPRMVPGGVICGDDVHHPPIQRAVWDTLGNTPVRGTLWVHRIPKET